MDNKQILLAYVGDRGYQQISDNIQQYIEQFKPQNIAEQDFQNELNFMLENSESPMFDITGFCTNSQQIAQQNTNIADLVSFIKRETEKGDMNYIVNLAKEEHIAKKKLNGSDYDSKSDKILQDLRAMFNEKHSVVQQAFNDGLLKSIESDILRKKEMIEFRNSQKSKRKNRISKGIQEWEVLNENFNFNADILPLLAYNPIGIKMDINNGVSVITRDNIIGTNEDGYVVDSLDGLSQEYSIKARPLMSAILNQYVPNKQVFEMQDVYDYDVYVDADSNYVIDTTLPLDEQKQVVVSDEDLQQLLFESYDELKDKVTDINKLNDIKKQTDNMLLLSKNKQQIVILDDLLEIVNPTNKNSVIIETLKTDSDNEKIVDTRLKNQLDGSTVTYKTMLNSIMEVLQPNQYQAENIMEYFKDKIAKDIKTSESNKVKIEALKVRLDELTKDIKSAETLIEISDPNSEIHKENTTKLKAYNDEYSKLLIEYKDLRELNAYYR